MVSLPYLYGRPMLIDGILFDLDGTLVDSAPTIAILLNYMREELGKPPHDIGCYRQWVSLGANDLISQSLEVSGSEVQVLLERFRLRYKSMSTHENTVHPTVSETLAVLTEWGLRLGVCSNKPTHLCEKVLFDTKLDQFFSCVVGGDTTNNPKPHRDPIDFALSSMKVSSERALLVGDSTVDQHAAKAAGIPFVFFTEGYNDGVVNELVCASIGLMNELLTLNLLTGTAIKDNRAGSLTVVASQ
jgi:phosphoglycolate phosphatase